MAAIAFVAGTPFLYIACLCLIGAGLGFFFFNFPTGRIFMGETGSQFLGFLIACLAVIGTRAELGGISLLVVPVIFITFILDVALTAAYRLARGYSLFQAHREHVYQLLHRLGRPQWQVSMLYYASFLANGALVWLVTQAAPVSLPWLVFGLIPIYLLLALSVLQAAHGQGLLPHRDQAMAPQA